MATLNFQSALLPDGVARNVFVEVDHGGIITRVGTDSPHGGSGCALPGIANLHSHAHQRAMAGRAERSGSSVDSFWTWRKTMYGFLSVMRPEQLYAIAAQLYVEMLKAGFTRVAEFQYLHHQPDGTPYARRAEMSLQTMQAAIDVGLGITNLPVLYQYGGFDQLPVGDQQRRFYNSSADYVDIVETLQKNSADHININTGIAAHSLRAVDASSFNKIIAHFSRDKANEAIPIHIHIAEQLQEVNDCLAWSGARPVDYLFEHFSVDERWCLIHATHMSDSERRALADSGAVAGLCPTTEANLGDGFFDAVDYARLGGRFGIGSDSHVSVSPVEELRWLEYGQRLLRQTRNELSGGPDQSTGRFLLEHGAAGGARACGLERGGCGGQITVGQRADIVVLDTEHPLLCERDDDAIIDSWIFSGNQNTVRDVYVGGVKVIDNGHHAHETTVARQFKSTLNELRSRL